MNKRQEDETGFLEITQRLRVLAEKQPGPNEWWDSWQAATFSSPPETKIALAQMVRDAGVLSDDAGLYLTCFFLEVMTDQRASESLASLDEQLQAMEEELELFDPEGQTPAPEEYYELEEQYEEAWDELFLSVLEEFGETSVAEVYRRDQDEYFQRFDRGRRFFHGPIDVSPNEIPSWLRDLAEKVWAAVQADRVMGPMGFRYREEDGVWEVLVYPKLVEVLGGADDGAVVAPGFCLDLQKLPKLFDRVDDFGWNALGLRGAEGPYIWIEGSYRSRELLLRILAEAPEDEEPGAKVNTNSRAE